MRGVTTLCLCIGLLAISAPSASFAGSRAPQALLDKATSADADLRTHPEKLKFRHHIQRVIRRWNWARRASRKQPALHQAALRGEASAWALMAHWSGRSDDRVQAEALAAKLMPVTDSAPAELAAVTKPAAVAPVAAAPAVVAPSIAAQPVPVPNGEAAKSASETSVASAPTAKPEPAVASVLAGPAPPATSVATDVDAPLAATGERSVLAGDLDVAPLAAPQVSAEPSPTQIAAEVDNLAAGLRAALAAVGGAHESHHAHDALPPNNLADDVPGIQDSAQWRSSTRRAAKPRQVSLLSIRRVIVDAGHGGKDPGAVGPGGVREADVNLSIARRLGTILIEKYGLQVIYTRSSDEFVSLKARTQIANEHEADLFISVHANAHRNRKVHGIETYYLNTTSNRYARRLARRENLLSNDTRDQDLEPGMGMQAQDVGSLPEGKLGQDLRLILADLAMRSASVESKRLAGYVQTAMVSGLRRQKETVKDLGVKHALFYVLLGARMPSVLVETGFISHAKESLRLADGAYQQHVARSIARGVMRFAAEREDVARRNKSKKASQVTVVASLPATNTLN